jgi:hypothetical protein
MQPQFSNLVMSSVYLYLDNMVTASGQAYTNASSVLYPVKSDINGYYAYGTPFAQLVSDFSINNANIMTGVYVGNTYTSTGYNNLAQINYNRGHVYFTTPQTQTISGNYSYKDFNIELTTEPEQTLITETKYISKAKLAINPTGIASNEVTYPIIYVKNNGGQNTPLAFGGLDSTDFNIRLIVLSDSQFKLDAVTSIIRDTQNRVVPLLSAGDMPFNVFGGYKSSNYNYTGIAADKLSQHQYLYIDRVFISKYTETAKTNIKTLNSNVFVAFCDMEIGVHRHPR